MISIWEKSLFFVMMKLKFRGLYGFYRLFSLLAVERVLLRFSNFSSGMDLLIKIFRLDIFDRFIRVIFLRVMGFFFFMLD